MTQIAPVALVTVDRLRCWSKAGHDHARPEYALAPCYGVNQLTVALVSMLVRGWIN